MLYEELKEIIKEMRLEEKVKNFKGFEESFEFKHFKTYFAMKSEPHYTLMQFKDSEEFNTSSDQWILCIPQDEKLLVMDGGTEEEICEQYLSLLEIYQYGFGRAEVRPKVIDEEELEKGVEIE